MAVLDGKGAVTEFVGFGGYWLVLVDMLMAVCMAAGSNLPAFLYGNSEVMAKVYGNALPSIQLIALSVQGVIYGCAASADR